MSHEALDARIQAAVQWLGAIADADRNDQVFGASMHRWSPIGPFTEDAIAAIEAERGSTLPSEYRRFVTTIARGGAGPYYGLAPLDAVANAPQPLGDPKVPFDPQALAHGTTPANGTVLLADQGCGSISVLVVSGPHAGEIWTVGDHTLIPEAGSFVAWLERWLRDATVRWAADTLPRIVDGEVPTELLDRPLMVHYATAALEWRAAGAPLDFTLYEGALPSPAEAARARGLLAAMQGDRDGAAAWLARAAPLEEKEPVARAALDRARVADIAKDPEAVLVATADGLAGPKPWAVTESLLLRYRMQAFDDLGRKDEALEVAERRAEKTYFTHAPHYALARRWIARGDWAEVERVMLRAAARAPSTMKRGATPREVAIAVLEPFAARLEKDGHGDRVAWARDLALRFAEGPPAPF